MTAKTTKHDMASYLDLGVAAVIAKPFDQRTLANELEQIAGQASSGASAEDDPELAELLDAYEKALPERIREIRELWAGVESGLDADAGRED